MSRHKVKLLSFLAPLVLVLLALSPFFIIPRILKIKTECRTQFGECSGAINKEIDRYNNQSYRAARRGIENYLSTEYTVSEYAVQYKLPRTLEVRIIIKKPNYLIVERERGVSTLIDADGIVLSIEESESLPGIISDRAIKNAGEKIDEKDLRALKIMAGIYKMYTIRMGETAGDVLKVDLPGQIAVIFPLDSDGIDVLLGSLRIIYPKTQEAEAAGKYSQIDLRFKNPVLR